MRRAANLVFGLLGVALGVASLGLVACESASSDGDAQRRVEPMRAPLQTTARKRPSPAAGPYDGGTTTTGAGEDIGSRPPADPEIERALNLIRDSGLRFSVPGDEPGAKPALYTAEQFAAMLRKKWDWIGYDIVELEPWLEQIASRSFKSSVPYQVVLEDDSNSGFREWLDAALARAEPP